MNNKICQLCILIILVAVLSGCNAGTTYSLLDDVKLNDNGTVTRFDGGVPQKKRILYHGEVSGLIFYDKNISSGDKIKFESDIKNYNTISEQRCVYMIWFLPINFWTYFFMNPESLAKQSIKDVIKKNDTAERKMRNIVAYDHWMGGLISYDCRRLSGKIIGNEKK